MTYDVELTVAEVTQLFSYHSVLCVDGMAHYLSIRVRRWLNENINRWSYSAMHEYPEDPIMIFKFIDETDAVAFKLRWL